MLIPFGILSAAASFGPPPRLAVAGYFAGGQNDLSTVDKFAFPADTRSTLGTGLSLGKSGVAGFSNSGVAGYVAGGFNNTANAVYTTVDKFAFPADTRTTLGTGLSVAVREAGAMANSAVAGYVGGGGPVASGGTYETTVNKFAFPADTRSTLGTGLSTARKPAGMSNQGVAGYLGGGLNSGGSNNSSVVNKFAFPADTASTLGTGLSAVLGATSGSSDAGVAGYFAGGQNNSFIPQTTVDKFAFPSDTRSTLGTGLSSARRALAGMSNTAVAGYHGGGRDSGGSNTTTVDKFAFPSDTRSTLGTGLSGATRELGAFSNEGVF
jgi:hypothetical protein